TMALAIRPNCEYCDKDLPPESMEARICSYECTFCEDCVEDKLHNVCPNCGGGFAPRPIRPATEWRPGLSVENGRHQVNAFTYRIALMSLQNTLRASETSRPRS